MRDISTAHENARKKVTTSKAKASVLEMKVNELTKEKWIAEDQAKKVKEESAKLKMDFEEIKIKLESVNTKMEKLLKDLE